MIESFVNGSYHYKLKEPAQVISKVKLNGVDISKYLTDDSSVSWYDVSKDSGRNTAANGRMILNVIADKYRLDLATRPMTKDETIEFFTEIRRQPTISVQFESPFDGQWHTISCYRGDRNASTNHVEYVNGNAVEIYDPITIAIIEL